LLLTERGANGEPDYMRKQFETSLRSLGTDYLDLYYVHRPDATVPIEVTIRAMAELVK
jgi:aryl-alcohol dehydrogenase-like predicted oxidoreductase